MTNSKSTKRALLLSALSILMCVAMLVGTTFAWFTDTASTAVNKIQAGTLDVALEMWNGEKWVNAEGETLNFKTADGRTTNILWEPGCTYELPTLRIRNNGNLALKYKVVLSGIAGDAELNEAIEWRSAPMFNNGTFGYGSEVSAPVLFEGKMLPAAQADASDYMNASGTFKIIGHMKEEAGNEYQGLSINGIAVTVIATQAVHEYDSSTNQYDKDATFDVEYITAEELKAKFVDENGKLKSVTLDKSYLLTTPWTPLNGWDNEGNYDVTIDGQGHTIMNMCIDGGSNSGFISSYANTGKLIIKDLTFENAKVVTSGSFSGVVIGYQYGDVTLDNVDVVNSYVVSTSKSGGIRIGGLVGSSFLHDGAKLNIKDCDVTGSNFEGYHNTCGLVGTLFNYTYASLADSWSVENCTVSNCSFVWHKDSMTASNFAYTDSSESLCDYDVIPAGVTVTNCTAVIDPIA